MSYLGEASETSLDGKGYLNEVFQVEIAKKKLPYKEELLLEEHRRKVINLYDIILVRLLSTDCPAEVNDLNSL